MDWALAIEKNRAALARIVAGLIAHAGLAQGGALARPLRNAILRILRPAEAAARRLIVIAARAVSLATLPSLLAGEGGRARRGRMRGRPGELPPLSATAGATPIHLLPLEEKEGFLACSRPPCFPLFDPPRRLAFPRPKTVPGLGPRISLPGVFDPVFRAPVDPDAPAPSGRLFARLAALEAALADLPRHALRLARWQARNALPPVGSPAGAPPFPHTGQAGRPHSLPHPDPARRAMSKGVRLLPLRAGRPPGRRRRGREEIDEILRECHALALDVLEGHDTS